MGEIPRNPAENPYWTSKSPINVRVGDMVKSCFLELRPPPELTPFASTGLGSSILFADIFIVPSDGSQEFRLGEVTSQDLHPSLVSITLSDPLHREVETVWNKLLKDKGSPKEIQEAEVLMGVLKHALFICDSYLRRVAERRLGEGEPIPDWAEIDMVGLARIVAIKYIPITLTVISHNEADIRANEILKRLGKLEDEENDFPTQTFESVFSISRGKLINPLLS